MIEENSNFCRVFEIPNTYPSGYCFGGGIPVEFQMVDWFNPIPLEDFEGEKVRRWSDYVPMIKEFLLRKNYVKSNRKYLVITDFDESFIFDGEEK
jgi:hypothetical protein